MYVTWSVHISVKTVFYTFSGMFRFMQTQIFSVHIFQADDNESKQTVIW